jgi:hypothetical protein
MACQASLLERALKKNKFVYRVATAVLNRVSQTSIGGRLGQYILPTGCCVQRPECPHFCSHLVSRGLGDVSDDPFRRDDVSQNDHEISSHRRYDAECSSSDSSKRSYSSSCFCNLPSAQSSFSIFCKSSSEQYSSSHRGSINTLFGRRGSNNTILAQRALTLANSHPDAVQKSRYSQGSDASDGSRITIRVIRVVDSLPEPAAKGSVPMSHDCVATDSPACHCFGCVQFQARMMR